MNLFDATVPIFDRMLGNVLQWLDKAEVYAKERGFDVEVLCDSRLAPDQYALIRQIQAACDTAKWAVSKMSGSEAPSHPDTETTLEELRTRIDTCRSYVKSFERKDFEGAEDRACSHQWMQGKSMRGGDYLDHFVLPNFHFHLTCTYQILRHNGVPLGKSDLLSGLPLRD